MACIRIVAGPEKFLHKKINIPLNVRESDVIFMEMAKANCFWEVDLRDLSSTDACAVKIIDFSARCARSIFMKVPIFVDNKRIIVLSISKKSVENALRKVVNLLMVLDGGMIIVKDDIDSLRIESLPSTVRDDFANIAVFANA